MNSDKKNEQIANNIARYINKATEQIVRVSDPELKDVLVQLIAITTTFVVQSSMVDDDEAQTKGDTDIKAQLRERGIKYEFDKVGHDAVIRRAELDK